MYRPGNNFELIPAVKVETRHSIEGAFVKNLRRSVIIAELWQPEVARRCKKIIFCVFFEKTTPSWNLADGKSVNSCVIYLTKNSPGSPALATERIAPKICQGQPPTMYSEWSRFHPHQFTFGGVLSELVNTVRVRSIANPILGWSLASRRIKRKQVYYNAHVNFIRTSQVNIQQYNTQKQNVCRQAH